MISTPAARPFRRAAPLVALLVLATACGEIDRHTVDTPSGTPPTADATTVAADPAGRSAADRYIDDHWPAGPSGTVIAARGGELVTCRGIGLADRERRIEASCDTVYDIGSITKSFTAVAVMTLEMAGKLQLNDPISAYLGPVPRDKRGITVHHLLTHTAGLPDSLGDDYEPLTRDAMVAAALAVELRSAPGASFHYSNTGYSLLAAIIETASGTGYEEYLSHALFEPAGMTRTGYVLPDWDEKRVAVEYDDQGTPQGRPFDHPWADDGPYWNLRGNGGLLSTAEDMLRWHQALRGEEILDRRAKELMFTPHVRQSDRASYGYGWDVATLDGLGTIRTHNGGNDWSLSRNAWFPEQETMLFWVSNHAYRAGRWNLEETDLSFSLGLAEVISSSG